MKLKVINKSGTEQTNFNWFLFSELLFSLKFFNSIWEVDWWRLLSQTASIWAKFYQYRCVKYIIDTSTSNDHFH